MPMRSGGGCRRVKREGRVGHFVNPDSPAATVGLPENGWVEEIDGAMVANFAMMEKKLTTLEAEAARNDFVLLVWRGGETAVLRVKLWWDFV